MHAWGEPIVTNRLHCLIIRQPYASLIAFGHKRWEFRSYNCRVRGTIGIASSHNPPLRTLNEDLNKISPLFPRGVVLAVAKFDKTFFVSNDDLRAKAKRTAKTTIHGHELVTFAEPIGEPLEDVEVAISNPNWVAHAWCLKEVRPLKKFISFERSKRSTWVDLDMSTGEADREKELRF